MAMRASRIASSPESGRVLIDGTDIAMADPARLRRQIGVVLQENVLFNRSVRENIALSDPAMPMERIIAAATLAGAHEFILELPEGYDTVVGERGSTLSGGQRQRIAIARALIADPKILIFDEATSALDYESERIIQQNVKEIAKGRTVLIIAHRLSTVRSADRIVTLERGRLVENGTYDALIKTGGRYATLHRLQRQHLKPGLLFGLDQVLGQPADLLLGVGEFVRQRMPEFGDRLPAGLANGSCRCLRFLQMALLNVELLLLLDQQLQRFEIGDLRAHISSFSINDRRMSTRCWTTGIIASSLWMVAPDVACSASFWAC